MLTDTGARVRVRVAAREVECRVWRVGRYAIAPLYLLEPTDPRDLWITRRLYDPRPDCRVAQEMLLGIGGVRALRALHLPVELYHFNEGHAVFAGIEMIADRMEAGQTFREAWLAARERIVFTTHTPVPAGNEVHPLADLRRLGAGCELVPSELAEIGGDPFNMTVAGLRLAHLANAVAAAPRRDRARHVGAREGRGAHHRDHQRRPRRDLAGRADPRRAGERRAAAGPPSARSRPSCSRRCGRAPGCGSIRPRRPSASRGAPPPTSGPTCCCAIRSASRPWSSATGSRSSSRARRTRRITRARR